MKEYLGKKCPFCHSEFTERDNVVFCSVCDMPHHLECWQANQGCTTFGCTGMISEVIQNRPVGAAVPFPVHVQEPPAPASRPQAKEPPKPTKRFEEIKKSDQQILFPEAKIVLLGYSIVRDNEKDGRLLARFSFRQFSDKIVSALLADIVCSDMWNKPTECLDNVQFLDLHADSTASFGQAFPVELKDPGSRNLGLTVKSVAYSDGDTLRTDAAGEPLRETVPLEQYFGDGDLVAQFKRETTENARYTPLQQACVRKCCCGAFFAASAAVCPVCGTDFNASSALLENDLLRDKLSAYQAAEAEKQRKKQEQEDETRRRIEEAQRLSDERAQQALEEKQRQENEQLLAAQKRKKRTLKIVLISAVAVVSAAAAALALVLIVLPAMRYDKGVKALSQNDYDAAYSAFSSLGVYKDAEAKAKETKYQQAEAFLDAGNYDEAIAVFTELGNYQDAKQKVKTCRFRRGLAALEDNDYKAAIEDLEAAGDADGAQEKALEAHYLYAKELLEDGKYEDAETHFSKAADYEDAEEMLSEVKYRQGWAYFDAKDFSNAYDCLSEIQTYKDMPKRFKEVCYRYALQLMQEKKWTDAVEILESIGKYSDSADKLNEAKYNYVLAHKNDSDPTTHLYLVDLKTAKYKDSAALYAKLYPSATPQETVTQTTAKYSVGTYVVTADVGLNVRQSPSATSSRVGFYDYNTQVTVDSVSGNWGHTSKGWICLDYARKVSDNTYVTNPYSYYSPGRYMISDEEGLNIRESPSANSKRLGVYLYKEIVYVTEVSGNWGRTDKGWICMDYVRPA